MNRKSVFTLTDKTILVTGASSGIGRCIAILCAEYGAKAIITGRDQQRLEETMLQMTGEEHVQIISDISTGEGVKKLVEALPPLDGVVHCAGVNTKALVKFLSEAKIDEVMKANFYAPALIMQGIIKQKKIKKQASVVMISSIASTYATVSNAAYASSKGALNSLTRVLAIELAAQKIRVNAILPGMVQTDIIDVYDLQEELKKFENAYPLGRFGVPEDVAYAVIYLLSDASVWVTGTSLVVDGGITLR